MEKQFYFLQLLLVKKDFELFENEYPKALKEILQKQDFDTAAKITRLLVDDTVFRKEATKANYERLLSLTAQYCEYAGLAFQHNYIYVRHKRAFAERTLHAIKQGHPVSSLQPVSFDWKNTGDNYHSHHDFRNINLSFENQRFQNGCK